MSEFRGRPRDYTYTDTDKREVVEFLKKKPMAELRRRMRIIVSQIESARTRLSDPNFLYGRDMVEGGLSNLVVMAELEEEAIRLK